MAQFTGMVMTNNGVVLQAKAQTGVALQFSRVGLGDGVLPGGGTSAELTAMTNLTHQVVSLGIQSIQVIGDGTVQINALLTNAGLSQGYNVREVGVFANDPDVGEILYAVAYAATHCDYIPPDGGATAVEQIINIVTVIGNATQVTAVFAQTAATDVEIQRHWVAAAAANGQTTFVLPWPYRPRTPNLAVYRDGIKQVRGLDWNPPTAEETAESSSTVVLTAAAGLTKGLEFFSIPVSSGVYEHSTVWHKGADYIINNSNNRHVLTNSIATGPIVFRLDPAISIGAEFTAVKEANFDLTIEAPTGETIVDSTAGGSIANIIPNQPGASLTLKKTTDTHWTITHGFGTWETA